VLAVARGQLPPTAGLVEPELGGLRHVRSPQQAERLEAALSSSFGFGGMSCVLAFAASPTAAPPALLTKPSVQIRSTASSGADAQPEQQLDPERSRRFDRASAFAASGVSTVLCGADAAGTGLVLGTAFGNVERTMAFLGRAEARGPRHVPPAEFPHLVPSAPAGNASIYAGLTGPVFAVSDLAQSGEAALAAGVELIELGVAQRIVVGAVAPRDAIVEGVLGPLHEPDLEATVRSEGAGFLLLEALDSELAPGVGLARLLARYSGELGAGRSLDGLPAPEPGKSARVVLGAATREVRTALAQSGWSAVLRLDLAAERGYHEALGAIALATAAELLAANPAALQRVLVLSGGPKAFTAWLFGRAEGAGD
jgi:3-oxoacyl-(acyl-carrier-protein) synthase